MVVKHILLEDPNTAHIWIDIYGNVSESNPGWSDYNTFSYYKLKPCFNDDIYDLQLKDVLKSNEHKFGTVVSIRSLEGNKCLICTVDYEDELVIEDLEFSKVDDFLNTQIFIPKLGEMVLPDYLMLIYAGDINGKRYY